MKYLILGVIFVAVPYMLLSAFVMPALESLKAVYGNADVMTSQVTKGGISATAQKNYTVTVPGFSVNQ
jgi:hypothetical protein